MKQNKKTVMIIGCIITICTFIAAVLIGWNHMVKITKGPKNEKEIGWSFSTNLCLTTVLSLS